MSLDEHDYAAFWRGHDISVAVARAALRFLGDHDYDGFACAVRRVHEQHCLPDGVRRPRPRLRLVMTGD